MYMDGFQNCNGPMIAILLHVLALFEWKSFVVILPCITIVYMGRVGAYHSSL